MGELYDEYLKKRKKNKKQIAEEWNQENPDQKISSDDLAPVRTKSKDDDLAPVAASVKRNTNTSVRGRTKATTKQTVAERSRKDQKNSSSTFKEFVSGYLDKGGLDEDVTAANIAKSILGTGEKLVKSGVRGVLGGAESVLDLGTFAIGKGAETVGFDEFAKKAYNFQQRDLMDETNAEERVLDKLLMRSPLQAVNQVTKYIDEDRYSFTGEKLDALTESAGQMGAVVGLQAVGVPWFVTTGTMGMGQGATEALKEGATSNEAAAYGAVSAGSEVLFEKLSGGIKLGGKTVGDHLVKPLVERISNKTAKTLVKYGLGATGEGFEEVLTEITNNIGKKLTYEDEKTWRELLTSEQAMESYLDAFIGGAAISGGFNVGRLGKSLKTGRDYDTGLSADEDAVVKEIVKKKTGERQKEIAIDEEVNRRIANIEKGTSLTTAEKRNIRKTVMEEIESGELELDYSKTKVSGKETSAITDEVMEDLKKGYVDMDDIENMFAGEEFEQIKSLMSELKKNPTSERKAEIEAKMDELKGTAEGKISELLKNSPYFSESYRQRLLKGESFTRDEHDTDTEITKELAESAKAAGVNNTGRMHDLFEYTNKIANDTSTKYGFTNSKQLKEMGYTTKDATINGMVRVQEDGTTKVLINVDSKKALNTIIGHETTHLFEGTKEHAELIEAVKEYAVMKGEYDSRFEAAEELYKNIDANIENEVTADLVGDYIFTDEQFIQELTKKPNVFQKVYDYIKHAYKMATAGSSEARQLLKAKRAFEKAYRNMNPETASDSDTKYAISYTKDNRAAVVIEKDILKDVPQEKWVKTVKEQISEFKPGVEISGRLITITSKSANHFAKSGYSNEIKRHFPETYKDKMNSSQNINEVLRASTNYVNEELKHDRNDEFVDFSRGDVLLRIGENDYTAKVLVGYTKFGEMKFYDLQDLEPTSFELKEKRRGPDRLDKSYTDVTTTSPKDIISHNNTKNNGKFSLAGENGLTANEDARVKAYWMLQDGTSELETFRETGWFKGADGKWRFEIDDSEANLYRRGDAELMKDDLYREYQELYDDFFTGLIEEEGVERLREIEPEVKLLIENRKYKTVRDYLEHPELFQAYPFIANIPVTQYEFTDGTKGQFSNWDGIGIDKSLFNENNTISLKKTLLHEIQHVIQHYEHFAGGANPDTWKGVKVRANQKKYEDALNRQNKVFNEGTDEFRNLLRRRNQLALAEDFGQEYTEVENELFQKYEEEYFEYDDAHFEAMLYKDGAELSDLEKYEMTAGEIEARDTANRSHWSKEDRKEKLPVREMQKGVIFAENPASPFEYRESNEEYSLSSNDDLAPVGGYAVYGKDVKVDGEITPISEKAIKKHAAGTDDIAPIATNDVEEIDPSMFEPWPDEPAAEPIADYEGTNVPMDKESMRLLTKNMKEVLGLNPMQRRVLKDIIQDYSTGKIATADGLYNAISDQFSVQSYEVINEELAAVKKALRETPIRVSDSVKDGITNYYKFRQSNFGKLKLGNNGLEIDDAYEALREVYPGHFPEDITNIEDQLYHMEEVANMESSSKEEYVLPEERIAEATDFIRESVSDYKRVKKLDASLKWKNPDGTLTRAAVHAGYMQNIKDAFAEKGMDLESVLANGKNLPTFATVDNTPQRVMEKTFGYKEGQLLSDLTVNKAAENETEAIRWLNSFTNKKNGTLAKLSKKYNIKPFSKEDAAAQKYAEGMHVNQYGDYVEYGDRELEADIKDPQMRSNIKAFVADPQLRQIYDKTLDAINASRTRNGYAPIPRRNDYFLHFREMDDTFSKIGIPFNPNDIKAKDLPTDINGMTADNKPGQPWFGSSMQRKGVGTTYSLLGGMEKYLTAAKPQIYHIDDIQVLRALRNSIADTYGQAKGLESLDTMTDEEAEARIEQVYGSHLSSFAKFLNEEANIMAGKTALIDRGMEGVLGRRAISFMNTLNSQVAKNMIGFNVSSSLTNFVSVTQAAAKASKFDVIKAFAQTTSNKLKSIAGEGDGFAEKNSAIVRRKGQDKFYKKWWEKASDTGFLFMSAIDDISTEFIVRTKYNELTRKGMSEEQAHDEAGKWAMRILGDRSFGQMPQIFNSKTLGLVTKFQLEVRNQLDSMFYDTVQEANVSTEEIQNKTARNAVKAAKITSTVVQLAVFQHLFGKAFESVAGYNPTFDIIENLMTLFGFDDEEDSEDTFGDNLEQALLGLGEDLPYFSALTGGRIPIEAALPIEQLVQGKDDYGNDKPRLETLGEALPYYVMPTGYGQIKKSAAGLKMFDKDLPITGSYTDSGNLRFPVAPTPQNIAQAAVFGQWANENAREYFDGEHQPLKEKQIEEFKDLDLPIADYWKIREGMSGKKKAEEKLDYIDSLDLPISKKNILANNVLDRKEDVDMTNYSDFDSLEEMDFAVKNPGKYSMSKAVGGYASYKTYNKALGEIKADKDSEGKSIRNSRKEKVARYINSLDADYGTKIILYKQEYPSDNSYNADIINYLNERGDINYEEMKQVLEELGFTVYADGNVGW